MMKRIAYTRPDGGVSIVVPAISQDDPPEFSEDDALARSLVKDVPPDASGVHVVDEADVPADRTFRNAWVDAGKIVVDMPKAKDIHRDRLRALRAPKMAALDIEYQRADEADDKAAKKVIAAKKQALRDVTSDPAIDQAKSPGELQAVMPMVLL